MSSDVGEYGIYRREEQRSGLSGWEVGIGRNGRIVGRAYFSDRRYGGSLRALEAAREFRDLIVEQYPPVLRATLNQRVRSNNRSGFPGVYIVRKQDRVVGYCAQTKLPVGKVLQRFFGFGRYGPQRALALAVEERARQLLQVDTQVAHSAHAMAAHGGPRAQVTLQDLAPSPPERRRQRVPAPPLPHVPDDLRERIARQRRSGDRLKWIYRFRSSWSTEGWRVVIRRNGRVLIVRTFMDAAHGGWDRSLNRAIQYRDSVASDLGLASAEAGDAPSHAIEPHDRLHG